MVSLASDGAAYVLSHTAEVTLQAIATGHYSAEEGIDGSFDLLYEINVTIASGKWFGDALFMLIMSGVSATVSVDRLKHLCIWKCRLVYHAAHDSWIPCEGRSRLFD